jgi:hypothetical protein
MSASSLRKHIRCRTGKTAMLQEAVADEPAEEAERPKGAEPELEGEAARKTMTMIRKQVAARSTWRSQRANPKDLRTGLMAAAADHRAESNMG